MLMAFLFLLYWGAHFVWLVIVLGGLMVNFMPRTKQRNTYILCVTGVLSLLLTIWSIDRGPEFDDSIMTRCETIREGCY